MNLKLLLISALFTMFSNAQAASVRIEPDLSTASLGEVFIVNILATDFDVVLDGGGLNLQFDPTIVEVTNVTIDTSVWDSTLSGIRGNINNTTGNVTGIFFNSFANVTGDFQIATIEFLATALGNTDLLLTEFTLNPFASGGALTPVTLVNGSATVVPLPGAGWLMLGGLGLLMSRHRRKKES